MVVLAHAKFHVPAWRIGGIQYSTTTIHMRCLYWAVVGTVVPYTSGVRGRTRNLWEKETFSSVPHLIVGTTCKLRWRKPSATSYWCCERVLIRTVVLLHVPASYVRRNTSRLGMHATRGGRRKKKLSHPSTVLYSTPAILYLVQYTGTVSVFVCTAKPPASYRIASIRWTRTTSMALRATELYYKQRTAF